MAAILGVAIDEVQRDRVGAAQEAARRFRAVAVLKGARTVVADPEGRVAINPTGNAGMASGGMGDALTGVVTSLLGQGMETFEAACAGAFLHGLAGDYAAQSVGGEIGILASDLIEALPRARERVARGEGPPSLLRRL
jgi:NAD(P)H-hydrate epimerase